MSLLPPSVIPNSLWREGVLHLPRTLADSFRSRLAALGLLDAATNGIEKGGAIGGASDAETLEHFTHLFGVSAGRIQYVTLNPDGKFSEISNAVLTTFSEGRVTVLDIPCGTGAGSCGLVATLIELRASNVMPRLPLSLSVLGGDFAERAREICGQMLADLEQPALAEGIRLRFSVAEWNATQTDVTAKLVDEWFAQSQDAEEFVVLVSNFSGHLKNAATFSDFSPCLEHVLARLHGKRATLLCIEPEMKQAESVFQRLKQFFSTLLDRFRVPWGNQPASKVARYQMSHPVSRQVHRSSVIVQSFTRR